jgi:hypothetical protein
LRHLAGTLDSAMLSVATRLSDGGNAILLSSHPLTLSLLITDTNYRGTISADGFIAGTQLDFFGRQILSATLDGNPLAFENQPQFGRLVLPAAGAFIVNFQAVPEPSGLVLLALGACVVAHWAFTLHRRRLRPAMER